MLEKTLVLLKPDAVKRNLCGEIIQRFERRNLQIVGMKMLHLSLPKAEMHYCEHMGKDFYPRLIEFITSGPMIAMALAGENAVQIVRTMMGATNPLSSVPGTIRGDFALRMEENVIHGSDSVTSAARELRLFFSDEELFAGEGDGE
jgi:nucleoside-diphosphate kinase